MITVDLHMPREASELYEPINREVGVSTGSLPDGLIHHFAMNTETGFNIFEVWESQEAFARFINDRLAPALKKVAGEKAPLIRPVIGKLHNEFHR